jgi:hypothetical protein
LHTIDLRLNGYGVKPRAISELNNAIFGESHEFNSQDGDGHRIRVFSVRIRHDGRIFGAGWTDRPSRPLLHDVGHRRLRLQLYEL